MHYLILVPQLLAGAENKVPQGFIFASKVLNP